MPAAPKKRVFFEKWIDPIAETLIADAEGSRSPASGNVIELIHLP